MSEHDPAELEAQLELAQQTLDQMGEAADAAGIDRTALAYHLFIMLVRVLTEEEVMNDAAWHSADQGSQGRA
jgi:hypothetical protein